MKSKMKRFFVLTLALCMVLTLAACGTQESASSSQVSSAPSQSESDSKPEESSQTEPSLSSAETSSSETSSAEPTEESVPEETGGKTLVAYFSCTGTTEGVAGIIADALGADTYEIVPEQPYTDDDLNYSDSSSRSTMEQNDDSCRPAISGSVENMDDYDTVFIGYPIWWGQAPKIIYTFMESYDFSGKTIVPFCTSGGSGMSSGQIEALAGSATVLSGKRFSGGVSESELADWVNGLGLK